MTSVAPRKTLQVGNSEERRQTGRPESLHTPGESGTAQSTKAQQMLRGQSPRQKETQWPETSPPRGFWPGTEGAALPALASRLPRDPAAQLREACAPSHAGLAAGLVPSHFLVSARRDAAVDIISFKVNKITERRELIFHLMVLTQHGDH